MAVKENYFERHPEADDILVRMWREGRSGGEIAEACGKAFGEAPTRNMIMGKVSRLCQKGVLEFRTINRHGPRSRHQVAQDMARPRKVDPPPVLPVKETLSAMERTSYDHAADAAREERR